MKYIFIIFATLILSSCAQGGMVMVNGENAKPVAAEKVKILFNKPKKAYEVIALVNSSVETQQFNLSPTDPETVAIKDLRERAAQAGADAVIEVKREVYNDGGSVMVSGWSNANINGTVSNNSGNFSGDSNAFGSGFFQKNYTIKYSAKAIKFK